jgi:hypothetical protein
MDDNTPGDPMTQLAAGVAQQHEMFTAYVEAGFTRPEALKIMIAIIVAHVTGDED